MGNSMTTNFSSVTINKPGFDANLKGIGQGIEWKFVDSLTFT